MDHQSALQVLLHPVEVAAHAKCPADPAPLVSPSTICLLPQKWIASSNLSTACRVVVLASKLRLAQRVVQLSRTASVVVLLQ
jgi:hypothetical protein